MSKKNSKTIKVVLIIAAVVLILVVLGILGSVKRWEINGPSMDPNYANGQFVIATKSDSHPSIDSVVIIKFPDPQVAKAIYGIKRVVATGGDKVVIANNTLMVYDNQHPNGYNPTSNVVASSVKTTGNINITVPNGDVFVLGDNRSDSLDSRDFGPLPQSDVVGWVLFKI